MKDEKIFMKELVKYIVEKAQQYYDFAGVADCGDKIIINSGCNKDIKITIEVTGE
jgi:hypothetical protein